ncbi:MAG TPA: glycosyltransferase [Luteolibacter sp.]|nr:glycosyltransferase [Luteolibacter sp.]
MITFLHLCAAAIFVYFLCLLAINLLLILLGSIKIRQYNDEVTAADFDHIAKSRLSLPISVIIPAHNEAAIIIGVVENTLKLDYPIHEVVVVDDGSTDQTLDLLIGRFGLQKIEKHGSSHIQTHRIDAVYESPQHPNLVVVAKENGKRADAINAGVILSRYPLLCIIDADCVIESDGLQHMARPFLLDPQLAAAAGVVRPSNGLILRDGVIVERRLPRTWLGMNQEVEYARSFQWARIGLNRVQSMLCISGALLLIKRTVFEETGGPWPDAITDDIEYTIRLNRFLHDRLNKRGMRMAFIPDAVSYTQVPEKLSLYLSQRNRWQRGTLQAILRNRGMLFNPRYGATSLFGLSYFLFFEAMAPLVEIAAFLLAMFMLSTGLTTWHEVVAVIFLAYAACVMLTLMAVLITETTRMRAGTWKDLWKMILAVFMDPIGWHQLRVLTSVWATIEFVLFRRCDLGAPMQRHVQPHSCASI